MFIATPTQTNTILRAVNSPALAALGEPMTFFELQDNIFDGGEEYCLTWIELLYDYKPYGYLRAIQAFEEIIAQS